jgi:hypothetical protein
MTVVKPDWGLGNPFIHAFDGLLGMKVLGNDAQVKARVVDDDWRCLGESLQ